MASMAVSSPMAVRMMTSERLLVFTAFDVAMVIRTGVLLLVPEELLDLGANLALGALDVVLHGTVLRHEGKETIVLDVELKKRYISHVCLASRIYRQSLRAGTPCGRRGERPCCGWTGTAPELLAGEDVDGDQVDLGVTVLAGLGGGHVDNLARAVLDDNVTVLAESGTLHGVGGRGTRIGGVEGHLML